MSLENKKIEIVVIMASHNRKMTTQRAVESLLKQTGGTAIKFTWDLILVDDGSSDGTAAAIAALIPTATICRGDGMLFWAAAMALAEKEAVSNKRYWTHLLWLNDDTFLDQDAIIRLLELSCQYPESIMVGATRDPETGKQTYGGLIRKDWHPLRFALVGVSASLQKIDSFHGNVVLIPADIQSKLGKIDGKFPHAFADIDYGLRAKYCKIPIFQAPGTVGVCAIGERIDSRKLSFIKRWQFIESKKGVPFKAQFRFLRRHLPRVWPVVLLAGYIKQLFVGLKNSSEIKGE